MTTPWNDTDKRNYRTGETAAVLPSETKAARTEPMTEAEFTQELASIRRRLEQAGQPLVRLDGLGAREKARREAEAGRKTV